MTRKEAVQRIWTYRILGFLLFVVIVTLLFISILKASYYADSVILKPVVENIVSTLYYELPVVSPIISTLWAYVPTPRLAPLLSVENVPLLILYVMLIPVTYLWSAAQNLAEIVKAVDNQLAMESMHGSVRNRPTPRMQENEEFYVPSKATFWGQVHNNYLAPIVVTVIGGIILFVLKMN
jgi:hypothetical protein